MQDDGIHEHEIHRMDDDGACVIPIKVKIGIAPGTDKPGAPERRNRTGADLMREQAEINKRSNVLQMPEDGKDDMPSGLVYGNGYPVHPGPLAVDLVGVTGETLNSLTWDKYLAWRKTKCRPFDYEDGPSLAMATATIARNVNSPYGNRAIEEIDQAVLELIGEVAELGELFLGHGPLGPFFDGERHAKLIDECGDVLFCACWAMDAWGANPLAGADDLEFIRVEDGSELAKLADAFLTYKPEVIMKNSKFVTIMSLTVQGLLVGAQTASGLLANSFKKLKFQRRAQDAEVQIGRIAAVMTIVNQILVIANSSIEEALKVNMVKLDARYPNGYQPGQGGGIREGAGA